MKSKTKPHFMKEIKYSEEPWRTDFIFGQKGSDFHGHLFLSGATIYYIREESNKEIIKNGKIVKKNLK